MADPAGPDGGRWWTATWKRVQRVSVEIAGEGFVTLMMIGLLWLVGWALDITHVGSHMLFKDAFAGTDVQFGLRLGALFDMLHLGVLVNFIYRSMKHGHLAFRGNE